jgi:hypothetical protein
LTALVPADNSPTDGNCNFRFPANPLLGTYKDAVLFHKIGSANTSTTSGFRTAIKGIFQDSTGATSLGVQISPPLEDKDKVDWDNAFSQFAKPGCKLNLYTIYGEGRIGSGCATKARGIYQDTTTGATSMSAIPCNSTSTNICELPNPDDCGTFSGEEHEHDDDNDEEEEEEHHSGSTSAPTAEPIHWYPSTDNDGTHFFFFFLIFPAHCMPFTQRFVF